MGKMIIGGVDMWGNMMATHKLYEDKVIQKHGMVLREIQPERFLALIGEIMEYAADTKCFKTWSVKPPEHEGKRLEEFVDGIHFYISKANELYVGPVEFVKAGELAELIATDTKKMAHKSRISLLLTNSILELAKLHQITADDDQKKRVLCSSLAYFLAAGKVDGFTDSDIEKMFYIKCRINQERQASNY